MPSAHDDLEPEDAAGRRQERLDDLRPDASAMREGIEALETQAVLDRAVIADLRAAGLLGDAKIANLEEALVSARRIGAAIGILMASRKITDTAALDLLRSASQRTQRKLRAIAEDVILTGGIEQ